VQRPPPPHIGAGKREHRPGSCDAPSPAPIGNERDRRREAVNTQAWGWNQEHTPNMRTPCVPAPAERPQGELRRRYGVTWQKKREKRRRAEVTKDQLCRNIVATMFTLVLTLNSPSLACSTLSLALETFKSRLNTVLVHHWPKNAAARRRNAVTSFLWTYTGSNLICVVMYVHNCRCRSVRCQDFSNTAKIAVVTISHLTTSDKVRIGPP